jgi:uncharacterized SAM-binding protein YcdF (DUF218 family)
MNKKHFYPLILIPTMVYYAVFQLQVHWRQIIVTTLFTTILIGFSGKYKSSETLQQVTSNLNRGLILLALILIFATTFPIGGLLSKHLMLPHAKGNADAIVVLASGSTPTGEPGHSGYQRVIHGARLFKGKRAPKLIISTGFSSLYNFSEYAWVASLTKTLELEGPEVIILKDESILTTNAEAEYINAHFPKIKNILLVTSGAHIKRSEMVFKKKGFKVLPAPVHNAQSVYYANDSYLTNLNAAIHEWIGLIYYRLRGRI